MSASYVFAEYFEHYAKDRDDSNAKAAVTQLNDIRNLFSHPEGNAQRLKQIELKKLDELVCRLFEQLVVLARRCPEP